MRWFPILFLSVWLAACGAKGAAPAAKPATAAKDAVDLPSPASPADAPTLQEATRGYQQYQKYCSLCHGKNAEGYAADNAPSLVSRTFRETASTEFLRTSIGRGRPGTAMAAYAQEVGGPLSADDIDAIIGYTRRIAPPQPQPPMVTLTERKTTGAVGRGQGAYMTQCAQCHGWTTQRGTAVHLFNPQFLASASDAYLRYAIENGRPGTKMEPWAKKLTAEQIDDVLAYIRSMATTVPPAPPVPWRDPKTVQQPALAPTPVVNAPGLESAPEVTGPVVIHPNGPQADLKLKDETIIPLEDVAAAYKAKKRMVIVDARAPSDYLRLHIPGAISVPYYDPHELAKVPNDGTWVIAYCACPHHASGEIVKELRKRGYKNTGVLDEGIFAWKTKGHPVAEAPAQDPTPAPPPPPPRQIVPPAAPAPVAPKLPPQ